MAQVAATFGGLAAVIAAVRQDFSAKNDHPFIVRDVVEISIIVTILSLLPFVPIGFGISLELSWRICCAAGFLLCTLGFSFSLRRGWRMWRGRRVLLAGTVALYFGLGYFLVASAAGLFSQPGMIYITFLLVMLAQAGLMFIAVLIPDSD